MLVGTLCPRLGAGERLKKLGERLHVESVFLNALDDRGFRSPLVCSYIPCNIMTAVTLTCQNRHQAFRKGCLRK